MRRTLEKRLNQLETGAERLLARRPRVLPTFEHWLVFLCRSAPGSPLAKEEAIAFDRAGPAALHKIFAGRRVSPTATSVQEAFCHSLWALAHDDQAAFLASLPLLRASLVPLVDARYEAWRRPGAPSEAEHVFMEQEIVALRWPPEKASKFPYEEWPPGLLHPERKRLELVLLGLRQPWSRLCVAGAALRAAAQELEGQSCRPESEAIAC